MVEINDIDRNTCVGIAAPTLSKTFTSYLDTAALVRVFHLNRCAYRQGRPDPSAELRVEFYLGCNHLKSLTGHPLFSVRVS
jgi:hypothetical protein